MKQQILKIDGGKEIRFGFSTYKGRTSLDIRMWYTDKEGELKPGKGISIPKENADDFLDKFIAWEKKL